MATLRNKATLDTTQFQGGLNKMTGGVKSLAGSLRAMPGIGGALSVAAIGAAVNQTMELADEIDNLANRTGLGIETVQAYKIGLEEAGLTMGDLESAITRLERSQSEAIAGNKMYADSFRDLGIEQKELEGLNTEKLLERVSQAMGETEGQADATAASYQLLGRSAGRLNEVLMAMNKEGIQAQIDAYKQLGLVIDETMIRQLDLAQLQVDRAGKQMSNWFATQTAEALDFGRVMMEMFSNGFDFEEALLTTGAKDQAALKAREDQQKKALEARQRKIESNAQKELEALQEKRRLETLSTDELRRELNMKLEAARAEMEQAQGAVARLEALKKIHELEGQIANLHEEDKKMDDPELVYSDLRKIGGNLSAGGGAFKLESGVQQSERAAQSTREKQARILTEIRDRLPASSTQQGAVL